MTEKNMYRLTFSILFSSEKDLEKAITTFNSWCKTQSGSHKRHGFIRTGQILGYLFLNSSERINTWTLYRLINALEFGDHISIIKAETLQLS